MKKILGLVFTSLLIVAAFSIDAFAQTYRQRNNIDARQRRQQMRIYQGARSGRLNSREYNRLQRQQYRIRLAESRYRRSGGRLTWRERYVLQRRLNNANRRIYRQKHDRQNNYYRSRRRL